MKKFLKVTENMTQEDKELLLKDLCAKFPYGIKVHFDCCEPHISEVDEISNIIRTKEISGYSRGVIVAEINSADPFLPLDEIKPYLRPMSSMTKKEQNRYDILVEETIYRPGVLTCSALINFCNEHHLDNLGLIEKGLALEALEGMYSLNK